MGTYYSPSVITNGLVFYYDMNNTNKSWFGQPTTNLLGVGMSIYNNVPSDVSAVLEATSETYMGATVYKQTLTPLTATGVSYLTGGNNPGIGVVTGGGGGTANRYTGFSIFYKTTVPMNSSPIFTNYSNIPGWQSGGNFSSMGDGWFRANVIWYDTVTRSDGKYWAINPLTATLNVPIVIYWAGPFKEDRNDSTYVSQYTLSSRSSTQVIIDLTNNNLITANNLTYLTNNQFSFNGSNGYLTTPMTNLRPTSGITQEVWFNLASTANDQVFIGAQYGTSSGNSYALWSNGNQWLGGVNTTGSFTYLTSTTTKNANTWYHFVYTYNGSVEKLYINGIEVATGARTGSIVYDTNNTLLAIGGDWNGSGYNAGLNVVVNGQMPVVKLYNVGLDADQVYQNFNSLRGRYGV